MLVQLHDGDAAGVLELARVPLFLRAVIDDDGSIDALDQLTDRPRPSERIVVYKRHGPVEPLGIVCTSSGCHALARADYFVHVRQPADQVARAKAAWRVWCQLEVISDRAQSGDDNVPD